ncbi:MAG: DUF4232 domain-containing protein [Solirubrobacteraceae bacterium]
MARARATHVTLVGAWHEEDLTERWPKMATMRVTLITLAALVAAALAGCGAGAGSGAQSTPASHTAAATAGHSGTSSTGTQTQAAHTTATASSAATSTAAVSAATTTAAPTGGAAVSGAVVSGAAGGGAANPCKAAGLALSFLGGQGATGHGELGFALKNTGAACATGGYPGIQFLSQDGAALPTVPQHTTSDFFGELPLKALALAPGQTTSFRLGVSHGGGSDTGCSTAYGLQVIPPNDTATLRVQIPDGASECGATTVSPLQSGTSAYQ